MRAVKRTKRPHPRPETNRWGTIEAGKQKGNAAMKQAVSETRERVNNIYGGRSMKRIVVGLLASAVISGTAWAQTPVTTTQGPVTSPAPVSVTAPKTWVDYLTLNGDVRLRYDQINDDAKKNSQGEDRSEERRVGKECRSR